MRRVVHSQVHYDWSGPLCVYSSALMVKKICFILISDIMKYVEGEWWGGGFEMFSSDSFKLAYDLFITLKLHKRVL